MNKKVKLTEFEKQNANGRKDLLIQTHNTALCLDAVNGSIK